MCPGWGSKKHGFVKSPMFMQRCSKHTHANHY
jgi:hypothetical protein